MEPSASVEDYLAALPAARRAAMEEIRRTIRGAAPDAAELISYRMPAFKTNGRFLVSYAAFKHHYSIFPASGAVVGELAKAIAPYLSGRGTIRFPANEPIPLDLVARVVAIRVREHAGG